LDILPIFSLPGILFLLTLVFGLWLSHLGRPYKSSLFNIHKLIALGTVIVLVIRLSKTLESADPMTLILALLVVSAVCVLALFTSGAMMSAYKLDYTLMRTIHRIASGIFVIALALAALSLLDGGLG